MQVIGQKESLCVVGPALGNLMAVEKGQWKTEGLKRGVFGTRFMSLQNKAYFIWERKTGMLKGILMVPGGDDRGPEEVDEGKGHRCVGTRSPGLASSPLRQRRWGLSALGCTWSPVHPQGRRGVREEHAKVSG